MIFGGPMGLAAALLARVLTLACVLPPGSVPYVPVADKDVEAIRAKAMSEMRAAAPTAAAVTIENAEHFAAPSRAIVPCVLEMQTALATMTGPSGGVVRSKVDLFHSAMQRAFASLDTLEEALRSDGGDKALARLAAVTALDAQMQRIHDDFASHAKLATPDEVKRVDQARRQQKDAEQRQTKERVAAAKAKRDAEQQAKKEAAARRSASVAVASEVDRQWQTNSTIKGNTHIHTRRLVRAVLDRLLELQSAPSGQGVTAVRGAFDTLNTHFGKMMRDGAVLPPHRAGIDKVRRGFIDLRNMFESRLPKVDEPRKVGA